MGTCCEDTRAAVERDVRGTSQGYLLPGPAALIGYWKRTDKATRGALDGYSQSTCGGLEGHFEGATAYMRETAVSAEMVAGSEPTKR